MKKMLKKILIVVGVEILSPICAILNHYLLKVFLLSGGKVYINGSDMLLGHDKLLLVTISQSATLSPVLLFKALIVSLLKIKNNIHSKKIQKIVDERKEKVLEQREENRLSKKKERKLKIVK